MQDALTASLTSRVADSLVDISGKVKGLSYLVRHQDNEHPPTKEEIHGIGELLSDLAKEIDAIFDKISE